MGNQPLYIELLPELSEVGIGGTQANDYEL